MLKKLKEKMKRLLMTGKETIKAVAGALAIGMAMAPTQVYAASYTAPLTKLKTVMITILTAAGIILLIYGGAKFAISFQKMDQNGEHQAIYTIIAGGVLLGIDAVVNALT